MSLTRTFLPASGPISMESTAGSGRSIVERFGGDRTHRMSEYYGIGVNAANATLPESGPLKFSDFHARTEMITTSQLTTTTVPGPGLGFYTPPKPGSGGLQGSTFFVQTQAPQPGVPGLFGSFFNPGSQFGFIGSPGLGFFATSPGQPYRPGQPGFFTQTQPSIISTNTITEFLTRVAPEPGA